jgi:hypothetical protein
MPNPHVRQESTAPSHVVIDEPVQVAQWVLPVTVLHSKIIDYKGLL